MITTINLLVFLAASQQLMLNLRACVYQFKTHLWGAFKEDATYARTVNHLLRSSSRLSNDCVKFDERVGPLLLQ
jgi:nucleoid-associated protein YejK